MASGYPDFEGTKSKLISIADWAAIRATDKNFAANAANQIRGGVAEVSYTVPAGKTLYIAQGGFQIEANLAADSNNNQIGMFRIYNETTLAYVCRFGGNGGGFSPFTKPYVFTAGQTVWFQAVNLAQHNCNLSCIANGYEV